MNDLELTKACAEAMGWTHLGAVGVVDSECHYARDYEAKHPGKMWCASGSNDWWKNPDGDTICGPCQGIPDPLHDDAQAMALVKKLRLNISALAAEFPWQVAPNEPLGHKCYTVGNDLNRAIVECVAKMQAAK